jgi:hypothetical protein
MPRLWCAGRADKGDSEFREYYAEMPWLALVRVHDSCREGGCMDAPPFPCRCFPRRTSPPPHTHTRAFFARARLACHLRLTPPAVQPFSDRARKGTLSSKFKVNGIPTLVWLNPDGRCAPHLPVRRPPARTHSRSPARTHTHSCTPAHTHAHPHARTRTHTRSPARTRTRTRTRTHTRTHTHTHAHAHTRTHTPRTCTRTRRSPRAHLFFSCRHACTCVCDFVSDARTHTEGASVLASLR